MAYSAVAGAQHLRFTPNRCGSLFLALRRDSPQKPAPVPQNGPRHWDTWWVCRVDMTSWVGDDVIPSTAGQAEYLLLSDALKQLPGRAFEGHGHPAVVLDRASGPSVRVWGWWSGESPALPCLVWCGARGWSATVVEPDTLDSEGYEREFWSHRIKLLDLALANALGPYPALEDLELNVAAVANWGLGARATEVKRAMSWGILHLRSARARPTDHGFDGRDPQTVPAADMEGVVDAELARHALIPTLAKARVGLPRKRPDPSVETMVRTLSNLRLGDDVITDK
jgi:hypothetical protein